MNIKLHEEGDCCCVAFFLIGIYNSIRKKENAI